MQAIKSEDPKRLVSAGSGYHGWQAVQDGHYRNLGLDFYDIHIYRDDGHLPDVRELNADKPVILGEFGQGTRKDDDALQQKAVPTLMRNALEKGYAGCFVWAYGPKEAYFRLVRDNGSYRPVVPEIEKIIKGGSTGGTTTAANSLKEKLAGTRWTNSAKGSFEWTRDGRLLVRGVDRKWKVLDDQRVQVVFAPDHIDTLTFNDSLTEFKQSIKGGSSSLQGKRTDK